MVQPKLLFVDDESSIRLTLPAILKMQGFNVTVAASVPEALEAIRNDKFDVLLSDLNIGEPGDGFTVISAMRRTQPEAVTCILTGYPDFETALSAIRNQVDEYFVKPANISNLVEHIQQKLANARAGIPQHPSPIKRVSQVIRENEDRLVEEWLTLVCSEETLSAIKISRPDRIDHVPKVLQQLVFRIESESEENSEKALETAEQHGIARYSQGYTIPQVIIEARLLQRVLQQNIQEHLLEIDLSTVIGDIMRVGETLASVVEESIRAYQEAERRALAKYRKPPAKRGRSQSGPD